MIFVTVGTTHFNELIMEVDDLVSKGVIKEKVYAQIGSGSYVPKYVNWTRYLEDVPKTIKMSNLVISHGGTGTVIETIEIGKPIIPVPNRELQDDHQSEFLSALEEEGVCNCCWELSELGSMITSRYFSKIYKRRPQLPKRIWEDLLSNLNT